MSPYQIMDNKTLKCNVRYAAARDLIELEAENRDQKREIKFQIIQALGGKVNKRIRAGLGNFVVFPDGTKAKF